LSLAFHAHRRSWDSLVWDGYTDAGLAMQILSFLALIAAIVTIFLSPKPSSLSISSNGKVQPGSNLGPVLSSSRLASLLLFHSFAFSVISFILYLPVLRNSIPACVLASVFTGPDAPSDEESRFASANNLDAALGIHATVMSLLYILTLATAFSSGRCCGRSEEESGDVQTTSKGQSSPSSGNGPEDMDRLAAVMQSLLDSARRSASEWENRAHLAEQAAFDARSQLAELRTKEATGMQRVQSMPPTAQNQSISMYHSPTKEMELLHAQRRTMQDAQTKSMSPAVSSSPPLTTVAELSEQSPLQSYRPQDLHVEIHTVQSTPIPTPMPLQFQHAPSTAGPSTSPMVGSLLFGSPDKATSSLPSPFPPSSAHPTPAHTRPHTSPSPPSTARRGDPFASPSVSHSHAARIEMSPRGVGLDLSRRSMEDGAQSYTTTRHATEIHAPDHDDDPFRSPSRHHQLTSMPSSTIARPSGPTIARHSAAPDSVYVAESSDSVQSVHLPSPSATSFTASHAAIVTSPPALSTSTTSKKTKEATAARVPEETKRRMELVKQEMADFDAELQLASMTNTSKKATTSTTATATAGVHHATRRRMEQLRQELDDFDVEMAAAGSALQKRTEAREK